MRFKGLLKDLIRSCVEYYTYDPSAASITLSYLEDKKCWYASVCRYTASFGRGKETICTATGKTLDETILNLAQVFLGTCLLKGDQRLCARLEEIINGP